MKYILLSMAPLILFDFSAKDFFEAFYFRHSYTETNNNPKIDQDSLSALGLNSKSLSPDILEVASGKNLLVIYLESIEKIHTEDSIFPGLTPEIHKLMKQGISVDIDQYPGTDWTMGAFVSSQCGAPLISYRRIASGNDLISHGFLQNAICLGDILKKAGYHQSFIGGADKRFGGKYDFLTAHGYDDVKGFFELENRRKDKTYRNNWGLNDDTLFEIAIEEFHKKAEADTPFQMTILTLNTHESDGVLSKSCEEYEAIPGNGMLNAIHCTDHLLGNFIDEISKSPAYANTVVYIMGDHLGWRNSAVDLYPKDYERKLFGIILNSTKETLHREVGTHMDVAPTILDAMGVNHNTQFLCGKSLFDTGEASARQIADDEITQDTIGYINSTLFSTKSTFPIEEPSIQLTVEEKELHLSDLTIHFYRNGIEQTKEVFSQRMGVVLLIDSEGTINNKALLNDIEVKNAIFSTLYNDNIFFMIVPNQILPCWLSIKQKTEGIGVYTGKFPFIHFLKDADHIEEFDGIRIEMPKGIKNLFSKSSVSSLGSFFQTYHQCCKDKQLYSHYQDESIIIPQIKVGDMFYQVHLKQTNQLIFIVHDSAKVTQQNENSDCSCAGLLIDLKYLFLPVIYPDDKILMHKMKIIQKNGRIILVIEETYSLISKFTTGPGFSGIFPGFPGTGFSGDVFRGQYIYFVSMILSSKSQIKG